MITSGHKIQYGVDTRTNPALIRDRVLSIDSVNRTYRGGYNDTRPPFKVMNLSFSSVTERELFERGSLTGLKGYNGVPPYTRSHIVATVGKHVFAGQMIGNTVYMKIIYSALNPKYLHQFMGQGATILVIGDGKSENLFWNGQTTQVRPVSESSWIANNRPMPIGNIIIYAHGRFWILTEDGILYAGDHLYSQGNSASDEVILSFSESAYPSSGDGFTATAEWGDARGLAVVPRDPSTNGHGEVICFHENGAYAVTPLDDRNEWTLGDIQQTILTGVGGCSPWSLASINSDIFFRRSDGRIASLRDSVSQKTSSLQMRSIGGEIEKYIQHDKETSLSLSMATKDDDRLIFTVNHKTLQNNDYEGQHRFAEGMVVFDLSPGTNSSPDQISWDGLWTGPRITGTAQMVFGSEKRAIFSSYDKDGINRLYTLGRFRGDDTLSSGDRRIVSMYTFGNMFDGISTDAANAPQVFTLSGSIVLYSDCINEASISADFRSGYSKNWFQFYSGGALGLDPAEDTLIYDVDSGQFNSGSVGCSVTEAKRQITGIAFDLRVKLEGAVIIRANLLLAERSEMSLSKTTSCAKQFATLQEDEYEYFHYQF
jgi:hypothetical protein